MEEKYIIFYLTISPLLWMLGGIYKKWIRRILLPIIVGIILIVILTAWLKALSVTGLLVGVNLLPYGDSVRWPKRLVVFLSLTAPALLVNWRVWPYVIGAWLLISLGFLLTRKRHEFTHKIWEGICGFLQATCIVIGILI